MIEWHDHIPRAVSYLPIMAAILTSLSADAFVRPVSQSKQDCRPSNSQIKYQKPVVEHYSELVEKVGIIGTTDDRVEDRTWETEYSVKVVCKQKNGKYSLVGSSQITEYKNVISTNSHLFYDDDCKLKYKISDCGVLDTTGGGAKRVAFVGPGDFGTKCPSQSLEKSKDWAVLKIAREIDVTPIKICDDSNLGLNDQIQVVSSVDSKRNKTIESMRLKQSCKVIGSSYEGIATDCDTNPGNSGSAVLKGKCLAGLVYWVPDVDYQEADPSFNTTRLVPISDGFRESIKNASK